MSVDGAEEDGVDNRAEAPSFASGEDSGTTTPEDGSDSALTPGSAPSAADPDAATAVPDGKANSGQPPGSSRPAGQADGSADRRNESGWQASSGARSPAAAPRGPGGTQPSPSPSAAPRGPGGTQPSPYLTGAPASGGQGSAQTTAPAAASRPGGTQPSPSYLTGAPASGGDGSAQTAAMAAVAGAASGARSIASKVGASFSGLTKPKPSPKAPPIRRPAATAGRRPPQPGGRPPQMAGRPPQPGQQTRRAMLTVERIEPMSVMKFSFLVSLVGWVVLFIAVMVVYFVLSKIGVFTKIEQTWGLVTYNKNHPGSNLGNWFRASSVLEYTALVCTVNAILFTALATVGAALYNLVTNLTGGIEVTLKESD